MPWQKRYDETEMVARAMRAFWARGYEATSVNDIVRVTGVNRGSLYAAFPDKRALFLEALRHYDEHHRDRFLRRLAAEHAPKDAIMAAFACAARGTGAGDEPAGCLLVNTALEVSPHDPEVAAFVTASFRALEDFFFDMVEGGKRGGTIRGAASSRATARALLGLFLGLRVLARGGGDEATLDAVTAQVGALLA